MKFSIRTFGCQMNVYDSERMAALLERAGFTQTADHETADIVVFNTCHIREKADHKFATDLGFLRTQTKKKPIVVLAGCIPQADPDRVKKQYPFVDIAVGPRNYHHLPTLIRACAEDRSYQTLTDLKDEQKFSCLPPVSKSDAAAYLTIQEGCNRFCAYCVVPHTRGREYSRPVQEVLDEAHHLVSLGVRELTLLGQNVDVYHGLDQDGKQRSLADLLTMLSEIPELVRLRYTTSYPSDFADDLILVHRDNPKVMPYVHLPIQAGSDRILKLMNRRYTKAQYLERVHALRDAVPDIALSSDFIVGFPSETDAEFEETLQIAKDVVYPQSFSFKYSARPFTRAADMPDQVPEAVKSERLARLQEVLLGQQLAFNQSKIGQVLPVLGERKGRQPGQIQGKSPYLQTVSFQGKPALIGQVVNVKITEANQNTLKGIIV